jgi:uncharacterized membrane protein YdjX (TVP38/TMEM64 family)
MLETFFKNINSVDFWWELLQKFRLLGPIAPMIMAFIESIIPPLPMVAIVTINVAAHGPFLGFLYSWVGSCLGCTVVFLFFRHVFQRLFAKSAENHPKMKKAREWVSNINVPTLFIIILLPFTPSAFMNFAFGVSNYSRRKYLLTLYTSKLIMIALLAVIGKSAVSALNKPPYIIISIAVLVITYVLSKFVTNKVKLGSKAKDNTDEKSDEVSAEESDNGVKDV